MNPRDFEKSAAQVEGWCQLRGGHHNSNHSVVRPRAAHPPHALRDAITPKFGHAARPHASSGPGLQYRNGLLIAPRRAGRTLL